VASDPKSLVQSQFGAYAANYVNSRSHARGASLARLVELTKPARHWRVLDVATGAGHTALAFAPHVAEVIASDVTQEMLDVTRRLAVERGLANVKIAEASAEDLPYGEGSFDLVTCRIAPHHFVDVARFVAEAARVLKPGGVFGLVDNISPDAGATAAQYNAFEKLRDPSHGRCLPLDEWLGLIERAGLTIRHCELLDKETEFAAWTKQMGVNAATQQKLRTILLDGSPELLAFLRPQRRGQDMDFTLTEALIIADRPA
jgi:ubiquinone/menaquinone biosynthesis C-methylase UbiE